MSGADPGAALARLLPPRPEDTANPLAMPTLRTQKGEQIGQLFESCNPQWDLKNPLQQTAKGIIVEGLVVRTGEIVSAYGRDPSGTAKMVGALMYAYGDPGAGQTRRQCVGETVCRILADHPVDMVILGGTATRAADLAQCTACEPEPGGSSSTLGVKVTCGSSYAPVKQILTIFQENDYPSARLQYSDEFHHLVVTLPHFPTNQERDLFELKLRIVCVEILKLAAASREAQRPVTVRVCEPDALSVGKGVLILPRLGDGRTEP